MTMQTQAAAAEAPQDVDDAIVHDDEGAGAENAATASITRHPRADRNQHLRIVEAVLFATAEPVDATHIGSFLPEGADVAALLADLQANYANRGVNLVEETGTTLKEIVEGVRKMAGSLGELVTAGKEQAVGVQEVTTAISQLDVITQKNAALADRSRDLAGDLKTRAEAMENLVATFRTGASRQSGRGKHPGALADRNDDDWQAA